MRKSRMVLLLLCALLTAGLPAGAATADQPITVALHGEELCLDAPPVMDNGRVLVPLRGVFEALGADVRWQAATNNVTIRRGETLICLTVGEKRAMVNGRPVSLDSPARLAGGRVLVPLRFAAQALGVEFRWSAAKSRVELAWPIPQVQPAGWPKDPNRNLMVVTGPERIYPVDGGGFLRLAGGGLSRLGGSGRVLWTAALPVSYPVLELLPAPEGNAFVLEQGGTLLALDNKGGPAWRLRLPAGGDQPRMALGTAGELFVTTGEQLWSITPQGEVAWVFPAPHPVVVPPVPAATGGVYLGTEQAVFSLSPAGAVRWSRPVPVTSPGMVPELDGTLRVYTSRGATILVADDGEVADLNLSLDGSLSGRLGRSWPEDKYVSLRWWLKGAEGQTYALDSRHRKALLALDVTGEPRWAYPLPSGLVEPYAVNLQVGQDGRVYLHYGDWVAVIGDDGREIWRAGDPANTAVGTLTLLSGGDVALAAGDTFRVFDGQGREKLSYRAQAGSVERILAVDRDGRVYAEIAGAGTPQGSILAAYLPEGRPAWRREMPARVNGAAVTGEGLMVWDVHGNLTALDAQGQARWQIDAPEGAPGWGCPAADRIYLVQQHAVTAFDLQGQELWRFSGTGSSLAAVPGEGGTLYMARREAGQLSALDGKGQVVWTCNTGGRITEMAAAANRVYVGYTAGESHEVAALDRQGSVLWKYPAAGRVGWIYPAGSSGTAYVVTDDNDRLEEPHQVLTVLDATGRETACDSIPGSLIPWLVGGDGRFYFSDAAGTALWATAPDGQKQLLIGGLVDGLPVVLEGGLVYLGQWGTLFALDKDGQVHLKQPLGYEIPQLFMAPGNRLWLRSTGPGGGSLGIISLTIS